MNFQASPGIAILKPSEENTETIKLTNQAQGRIWKGEIIAMGEDDITVHGVPIVGSNYGKIGDTVYFMHYYDEGGVDYTVIDGQKYYFVKWQDFRAIIK